MVPVVLFLGVLGAVGLALFVTCRPGRRERLGVALVAAAAVALLSSIVLAESGSISIYGMTGFPPGGTEEVRVTCASRVPASASPSSIDAPFYEACADATASGRTTVYGLLSLAGLLLVAGAIALWPRPGERRRTATSIDAGRAFTSTAR